MYRSIKGKVFELVPEGSSNDLSEGFKIELPKNTLLLRRNFAGVATQLSKLDGPDINYKTSVDLVFLNLEVISIGEIEDKVAEGLPNIAVGDTVILRRHAEFTMIPTFYRDDAQLVARLAKAKNEPLKYYKCGMYGLVNIVDVFARFEMGDKDIHEWADFLPRQ